MIPRVPACLVVVLVGLLLCGCRVEPHAAPSVGREPAVSAPPALFPASDELRAWDRARARAFAAGDAVALRRLYVDGSRAGTSDVRLLRAYLRRGLTVRGMRMQVLALEVLHDDPRRLRLIVTDRLTGALATGDGLRVPLPQDRASTRVVELRRPDARAPWRMAFVRESSRRPAADRGSGARTRTHPRAAVPARP